MKKIFLPLLLLSSFIFITLVIFLNKRRINPSTHNNSYRVNQDVPLTTDDDEYLLIIKDFENNFEEIQKQIEMEPTLGAYRFYGPFRVQIIGDNKLIADYEDGHVTGAAVFRYTNGKDFTVVNEYQNVSYFSKDDWDNIISNYGQGNYLIKNYAKKDNWSLTDENVFVK
jgi:hypothetical protein